MKLILTYFFCTVLLCPLVRAQSILQNGDFEDYTELPEYSGEFDKCVGWNALISKGHMSGSPDYYNELGIYSLSSKPWTNAIPLSGDACMGICLYSSGTKKNFREYISSELDFDMELTGTYEISFWINTGSPSDVNIYSVNGLGVLLSTQPVSQYDALTLERKPQFMIEKEIWTDGWERISFEFSPDSMYRFITLGGFLNDSEISVTRKLINPGHAAISLVDDISVKRTDEYVKGPNVVCLGESGFVEAFNIESPYWFADSMATDTLLATSILHFAGLIDTTFYYLTEEGIRKHDVKVVSPRANFFSSDTTICSGDKLIFIINSSEFSEVLTNIYKNNNEEYEIEDEGIYYINARIEHCLSSDTIEVSLKNCLCEPMIPNSFSPNGDGINDQFQPIFNCPVKDYQFIVFNRWGDIVYQSKNVSESWDGRDVVSRVQTNEYVYSMTYILGEDLKQEKHGRIYLLN